MTMNLRTHLVVLWVLAAAIVLPLLSSCKDSVDTSIQLAKRDVPRLVSASKEDVDELRRGMPQGAQQLEPLLRASTPPRDDLQGVRDALDRARYKVQDLRTAKSTFFALVDGQGQVLRTDREPDMMAGKNLFTAFPETRGALDGKMVQTRGTMPEASGVKGRPDGQWVLAVPVQRDAKSQAIFASGWSWSAYAYRLENAARGYARDEAAQRRGKEPLLYVYVMVNDAVYGAPVSPTVNAEAIRRTLPLAKIADSSVHSASLQITGRDFGLAVQRSPALGENVAIAILRSET